MIRKEKLDIVREYLCKAFKDYKLEDRYDYAIDAHTFKLTRANTRYTLKISEDVFIDNSRRELVEFLRDHEVADKLRESDEPVLLTGRGFKVREY